MPDLNPIPAGHAGTSLSLISLSTLINAEGKKSTIVSKLVQILGLIVGTYITFSSATRSASLALILGVILILLVKYFIFLMIF